MANVRVDDDLKKAADKMFDAVGMSTSGAVKIFLTRFVQTGKFPFDIEIPNVEEPTRATARAFQEAENIVREENFSDEPLEVYFERMKKEAKEGPDA